MRSVHPGQCLDCHRGRSGRGAYLAGRRECAVYVKEHELLVRAVREGHLEISGKQTADMREHERI